MAAAEQVQKNLLDQVLRVSNVAKKQCADTQHETGVAVKEHLEGLQIAVLNATHYGFVIQCLRRHPELKQRLVSLGRFEGLCSRHNARIRGRRSEEHTSELQSP